MDLLHIADLHVSPPYSTLQELWNGPDGALRLRACRSLVKVKALIRGD